MGVGNLCSEFDHPHPKPSPLQGEGMLYVKLHGSLQFKNIYLWRILPG